MAQTKKTAKKPRQRGPRQDSVPPTARIVILHLWAHTSRQFFELLRPLLFRTGKQVVRTDQGVFVQPLPERCFNVDPPDTLWIPAGVVPAAEEILWRHGITVEVQDLRAWSSRLAGDEAWRATRSRGEQHYLDQIARHHRALIAYPYGSDRLLELGGLLRYCRQANALVVAANLDETQRVARDLAPLLEEPVQVHENLRTERLHRVAVAPTASFERVDPGQFDICAFLDVRYVLGEARREMIERLALRSCYAFFSQRERYHPREIFILRGMIGPTIYPVPLPAVRVQFLTVPSSPVPSPYVSALDRKRQLYWVHDARNDFLADVARQFHPAHGSLQTGDQHGHPIASPELLVRMIAESPEHARQLHARLPNWRLETQVPMADNQTMPWSGASIMTLMSALHYGQLASDVVIWAGGGEPPLALPSLVSSSGGPVQFVDLMDGFDKIALAASRRRQRDYTAGGWQVMEPA